MFKRLLLVFLFVLLLALFSTSVFAKTPTHFDDGWWGNTIVADGNVSFDFEIDSIEFYGTVTQPEYFPGRPAHGIFVGTLGDGEVGECKYTVARFTLPNGKLQEPFRATMYQCTGGLEGFHMHAIGYVDFSAGYEGPWEGSYHYGP